MKFVLNTTVVEDRVQNIDLVAMGNFLSSEPVETSPQATEIPDYRHSQNLNQLQPPSYFEATQGNTDFKLD